MAKYSQIWSSDKRVVDFIEPSDEINHEEDIEWEKSKVQLEYILKHD